MPICRPLERTTHYTYCPYKGDCPVLQHRSIGGTKSGYAVGHMNSHTEAMLAIKEHLGFIRPASVIG